MDSSAFPPPSTLPDHFLLRQLRDGQEEAATQLYLRYAKRLYTLVRRQSWPGLARREDADDIVQAVFAAFFQGVRNGQYDVPPDEVIWKLLLVIALNKIRACGNFHHAACRDIRLTRGGDALEEASPAQTSEAEVSFLRLVIEEALQERPPHQAQMIGLRIEGYEIADIAARTGRSRRSVERVLQEFRQQLADVLDDQP